MRIGLAPLAAAVSVAGLIGVGTALATTHASPRPQHVEAVLAPGAAYFHDVASVIKRADANDDRVVQPPIAAPSCPGGPSVHFGTPQEAMRYLASAWNHDDLAALCHVTNPNARFLLDQMHDEAVNLRLKSCQRIRMGQYSCQFIHDYPAHMHRHGVGHAWLDVEAADAPGWYMTVLEGCG